MKILTGRKTRLVIFTVSLALLLVLTTTAGSVWHHHATTAAESNCPICHLGHQPAQQPAVMHSAPVLLAVGSSPNFTETQFRAGPVCSRLAARAPPSL